MPAQTRGLCVGQPPAPTPGQGMTATASLEMRRSSQVAGWEKDEGNVVQRVKGTNPAREAVQSVFPEPPPLRAVQIQAVNPCRRQSFGPTVCWHWCWVLSQCSEQNPGTVWVGRTPGSLQNCSQLLTAMLPSAACVLCSTQKEKTLRGKGCLIAKPSNPAPFGYF